MSIIEKKNWTWNRQNKLETARFFLLHVICQVLSDTTSKHEDLPRTIDTASLMSSICTQVPLDQLYLGIIHRRRFWKTDFSSNHTDTEICEKDYILRNFKIIYMEFKLHMKFKNQYHYLQITCFYMQKLKKSSLRINK